MASRGTYHTKQRAHIQSCLASHGDRYLTVREVCSLLEDAGTPVGHTTAYRNLEAMVEQNVVVKAVGAGNEARYRLRPDAPCGQLVCLDCGRVESLDCEMIGTFAQHVRTDHGFAVEMDRSLLYGHCDACRGMADR